MRARLAELQTIGTKLTGHGPTFFNEYEIYGDRHFLRSGAPVEPEEYRPGPAEDLPTFRKWSDAIAIQAQSFFHSTVTSGG